MVSAVHNNSNNGNMENRVTIIVVIGWSLIICGPRGGDPVSAEQNLSSLLRTVVGGAMLTSASLPATVHRDSASGPVWDN